MSKAINISYCLTKLRAFYREHDRLPSLGEIAELFQYSSRNSAVGLVAKFIEQGYFRKSAKGRLLTTPIFNQRLKVLGSVTAGFPSPEEEELRNTISLDDFLVRDISSTYLLEVKGDSMLNAGIMPGDLVLVEKGKSPKPGDIVIAQVDDEWTLKYFRRKGGKICLEAANPKYTDIYPQQELIISGIVVSSCRKYG